MDKSRIYLDLSKCTEEEIKETYKKIKSSDQNIHTQTERDLINGIVTHCYWFLFFDGNAWNQNETPLSGRTELTYPEFIKLFEGGDGEKTGTPYPWIDAQKEQPLCVSTGNWDGKQSDIVLAETFTGKLFLAQCYEGFMDGSKFYDWCQVDEINSNDWLVNESVSRWMKIPS